VLCLLKGLGSWYTKSALVQQSKIFLTDKSIKRAERKDLILQLDISTGGRRHFLSASDLPE